MSRTTNRWAVSLPNAVIVGVLLAAALAAGVTAHGFEAVLLVVAAAFGYGAAVYARRTEVGDVTRVNSLEYRDERDRHIAERGFAIVGVCALVIAGLAFAVALVLDGTLGSWRPSLRLLSSGYLMLLCLIWAVGNWVAARRS